MNRLEWVYVPKVRFKNDFKWYYINNFMDYGLTSDVSSACLLQTKGDAYSVLLDALVEIIKMNKYDLNNLVDWRVIHCQVGDLIPKVAELL